jgi:seryl-tRNA synthetase
MRLLVAELSKFQRESRQVSQTLERLRREDEALSRQIVSVKRAMERDSRHQSVLWSVVERLGDELGGLQTQALEVERAEGQEAARDIRQQLAAVDARRHDKEALARVRFPRRPLLRHPLASLTSLGARRRVRSTTSSPGNPWGRFCVNWTAFESRSANKGA